MQRLTVTDQRGIRPRCGNPKYAWPVQNTDRCLHRELEAFSSGSTSSVAKRSHAFSHLVGGVCDDLVCIAYLR